MGNLQTYLDNKTTAIRNKYNVPAMAAVLVNSTTTVTSVKGVRKTSVAASDPSNTSQKTDYFNVGSVSKPITGYLLAALVQKNIMSWATKLRDVFPEFTSPAFRKKTNLTTNFLDVTAEQLMAHTSGIFNQWDSSLGQLRSDPPRVLEVYVGGDPGRFIEWENDASNMYRRYLYTILAMQLDPIFPTGTASGYGGAPMITAAMAERLTGKSYELLVHDHIAAGGIDFKLGALSSKSTLDGTWQHSLDSASNTFVPNDGAQENLYNFNSHAPAGGVRCTVAGMGAFIRANFIGMDYFPGVVNHANLTLYQQQLFSNSARGGFYMGKMKVKNVNKDYLTHNGDNGVSRAEMNVFHKDNFGYAAMTNSSSTASTNAVNEMLGELKTMYENWDTI